eukprot:scpid48975/ scgid29461/ Putative potassium channel protein RPA4233
MDQVQALLIIVLAGSFGAESLQRGPRVPGGRGTINIGKKLDCLKELDVKDLGVLWYDLPPYAEWHPGREGINLTVGGLVPEMLNLSLATCCEDITSLHYLETNYSAPGIQSTIISDIVYSDFTIGLPLNLPPQLAYQDNYVPVVQSPGAAYVVQKSYVSPDILKSLHDAQYLLLFVLATASLAGTLMWAAEHHTNNYEFSAPFPGGIFNGFWWAMVTMTTVGFGDKVPRSFFGRLIALLWMICGVIILTMFTATVTTSFTTASLNSDIELPGSSVAVLLGAPEYSYAVKKGANVTVHASTMFEALEVVANGTVDGLLIDQLLLGEMLSNEVLEHVIVDSLQVANIYVNPVQYGFFMSPNGSSGVVENCATLLVQNKERDIYLAVQELTNAVEQRHISKKEATSQSITSVFKEDWEDAVIWSYVTVGIVLSLGLAFHFLYWRPKRKAALLAKRMKYDQLDGDDSPSPSIPLGTVNRSNSGVTITLDGLGESPDKTAKIKELLQKQFREMKQLEFERDTRMQQWEEKRRNLIDRHDSERQDLLK